MKILVLRRLAIHDFRLVVHDHLVPEHLRIIDQDRTGGPLHARKIIDILKPMLFDRESVAVAVQAVVVIWLKARLPLQIEQPPL